MKKLLLILSLALASIVSAQAQAATPAPGDFRGVVVNSDGATYNEKAVPFSANAILTFGGTSGTLTSTPASTFATAAQLATVSAAQPDYRTGTITFTSLAGTKTITYTNPFTTGTAWNVVVNPNQLVTSYAITNSTANGFTLTLPVSISSGTMTFIAVPVVSGKN